MKYRDEEEKNKKEKEEKEKEEEKERENKIDMIMKQLSEMSNKIEQLYNYYLFIL